jgi:hypothetical protein
MIDQEKTMQKYTAVITVTIDEFEAQNQDHERDIVQIFINRILDARICESSDIQIQVDTFIKEEIES